MKRIERVWTILSRKQILLSFSLKLHLVTYALTKCEEKVEIHRNVNGGGSKYFTVLVNTGRARMFMKHSPSVWNRGYERIIPTLDLAVKEYLWAFDLSLVVYGQSAHSAYSSFHNVHCKDGTPWNRAMFHFLVKYTPEFISLMVDPGKKCTPKSCSTLQKGFAPQEIK